MADYDDTNSGILFFNDEATEKQPDWTGKFNLDGKEFKLAGWIRHSKKTGKEFISLKKDDFEPDGAKSKGKDSASWQAAKEKFSKSKDEEEEPISLNDIPF